MSNKALMIKIITQFLFACLAVWIDSFVCMTQTMEAAFFDNYNFNRRKRNQMQLRIQHLNLVLVATVWRILLLNCVWYLIWSTRWISAAGTATAATNVTATRASKAIASLTVSTTETTLVAAERRWSAKAAAAAWSSWTVSVRATLLCYLLFRW